MVVVVVAPTGAVVAWLTEFDMVFEPRVMTEFDP